MSTEKYTSNLEKPKKISSTLLLPKDSRKRKRFKTGAIREEATGKGRYDMRFWRAIHRVALRYELGGLKYEDSDNFLKGIPLRRFVHSCMHHCNQLLAGLTDEDHAGAAAWNLLAMMEIQGMIAEGLLPENLDDLPICPERDLKKMKEYFKKHLPYLDPEKL